LVRKIDFMGHVVFPNRLISAVLITVLLAACGNSANQRGATEVAKARPSEATQSLSYQAKEVMALYKAATASFPNELPADITFPGTLPSYLLEDNYVAEAGVAEGVASFYWLCAWQDALLTAASSNEQGAAAAAFERLSTDWESLPYYQKYVEDPERLWRTNVLDPATRGDFTPLERDFQRGCRFYLEHNVPSEAHPH
jgi:hypothetical protein